MQRAELKTIKELPPNVFGKDYIIADLHGNLECYRAVIKMLKPGDRLFILGDLTDRGPESEEVVDEILKHIEQNATPAIFVIRGNHEDLCLRTIKNMEDILRSITSKWEGTEFEDLLDDKISESELIESHVREKNGGKWLLKLYLSEVYGGDIRLENGEIKYLDSSQIKTIKEYFESLPYIIHVGGDDPMNLVHANMPISDTELRRRFNESLELTPEQIEQAIWAKHKPPTLFINPGRNLNSILTYCGHVIVLHDGVQCVRKDTNTIDADVGCYITNTILLINHTDKTAVYVGNMESNKPKRVEKLKKAGKEINDHLAFIKAQLSNLFDKPTMFARLRKEPEPEVPAGNDSQPLIPPSGKRPRGK